MDRRAGVLFEPEQRVAGQARGIRRNPKADTVNYGAKENLDAARHLTPGRLSYLNPISNLHCEHRIASKSGEPLRTELSVICRHERPSDCSLLRVRITFDNALS